MKHLLVFLFLLLAISVPAQNQYYGNFNGTTHPGFTGDGGGLTNVPGTVLDVTRPPFNAVGNGVADDTAAFTAALAASASSGLPVFVPKKVFFVQPFEMDANEAMYGEPGARLLFNPAATGIALLIQAPATNVTLYGLELIGNNGVDVVAPTSQYNTEGLRINNCQAYNLSVHDLYIHGFGTGCEIFGTASTTQSASHIRDITVYYNWIGFQMDAGGEYNTFTGLIAAYNNFGIWEIANNNTFASCHSDFNNYNLNQIGRSQYSSSSLNHAGTQAITSTNNSNGSTFSGVALLPPLVYLTNSLGFQFDNCAMGWISISAFTFDHCTNCAILWPINPFYPIDDMVFMATSCSNVVYQRSGISTTQMFADVNGAINFPSNIITVGEKVSNVGANKIMGTDAAGNTTNVVLSGLTYSGGTLATTGSGTVTVVAKIANSTTSNIGTTTIATLSSSTLYRINYAIDNGVGATTATLTIGYTDSNSNAKTIVLAATTANTPQSGVTFLSAGNGNITYAITLTGTTQTDYRIVLESF